MPLPAGFVGGPCSLANASGKKLTLMELVINEMRVDCKGCWSVICKEICCGCIFGPAATAFGMTVAKW
jgi:hypothetical protein